MEIKPLSLSIANAFVERFHRHHKRVQGHKFSIGLYSGEELVGVAICGRPVARKLDDGLTIEVTRLCTNGVKNACSVLYSGCARIAREMGYTKIITYILQSEGGASLKASNWRLEGENLGGLKWKRNDGERTIERTDLFGTTKKYPSELKKRFVLILRVRPTEPGRIREIPKGGGE